MADDDEDDYLSDKFLFQSTSLLNPRNSTYAEIRKRAKTQSHLRNERNRTKSRRQLEQEAREEGLRKSLFERAMEEKEQIGVENKAMAMMMKMGFRPGQSLGKLDQGSNGSPQISESNNDSEAYEEKLFNTAELGHRKEPLPIDAWVGKLGVGLGKRAASPDELERVAKAAKLEDESNRDAFRTRTRYEYEERRAEGRLMDARKTLLTLDETAGEPFNILALDPHNLDTFPEDLLSALSDSGYVSNNLRDGYESYEAVRLRQQMRRDALEPINADLTGDEISSHGEAKRTTVLFSDRMVEEAQQFITLSAQERLNLLLSYLRRKYFYCFWCGFQYNDANGLASICPGEAEDEHD